jgi:hypothetical protein
MISRFSEDIDITVFREDIGQAATVEELEALSGKKRGARLDAIRQACQNYINGPLLERYCSPGTGFPRYFSRRGHELHWGPMPVFGSVQLRVYFTIEER